MMPKPKGKAKSRNATKKRVAGVDANDTGQDRNKARYFNAMQKGGLLPEEVHAIVEAAKNSQVAGHMCHPIF